MKALKVMALLSVAALSACGGASRHCIGEQEYQQAQTLPPPAAVDGLNVPQSPSALQIPPAPKQPVAFGHEVTDADGSQRVECLDMPPRMKVSQEAPEDIIGKPAPGQALPKPVEPAPKGD